MNINTVFLIESVASMLIVFLTLVYLRPFLRRILLDLCGTDERAQFWTTFTNILLLSLPMISALGFYPDTSFANPLIAVARQLKSNLLSFVMGLILVGFVLLFFTVFSSRVPTQKESK